MLAHHLTGVEDTVLNGRWAQGVLPQGDGPVTKEFTSDELGKCLWSRQEENTVEDKMIQEFERYKGNSVFHDSCIGWLLINFINALQRDHWILRTITKQLMAKEP